MADRLRIVLGPPGTGKTTTLLDRVAADLAAGVPSQRIGFVSFSRRAVGEARDRLGGTPEEFPHFRTIHSTAYHALGLASHEVLQAKHLEEFGEYAGLRFSSVADRRGGADGTEPVTRGGLGDKAMAVVEGARARGTSVSQEWRRALLPDLPLAEAERTADLYARFKQARGLVDFGDMLSLGASGTFELPVDVLYVDEAQDTSAAQWAFLRAVSRRVPRVTLAGDDDQAVYGWSGADADALRRFAGVREVLPQSHRLPARVKQLADQVAARIRVRVPKTWHGEDKPGTVEWCGEPTALDLNDGGTWLLLARSHYQLGRWRELARRAGVVYSLADGAWSWNLPCVRAAVTYERLRRGHPVSRDEWSLVKPYLIRPVPLPAGDAPFTWDAVADHLPPRDLAWLDALPLMPLGDREYVRVLRRHGESLVKPGRVRIGTVHNVKGAEAHTVAVTTDISGQVAHGARVDPDSERRVQYVAVTRTKRRLVLMSPETRRFWDW